MKPSHVVYLICPDCQNELDVQSNETVDGRIKNGTLNCKECPRCYPIINFVPRLLCEDGNYTESFGYQWTRHYSTQYDRHSGLPISRGRFYKETRWPKDLHGQVLLEAGSGSGRFTEHAAATDAMVISFDYSRAVDANYENNGQFENVLIVQADIYHMPFRRKAFDKIFCFGVLQHTPDPERAFFCLSEMLKEAGNIVVDAYARLPWWKQIFETKYWFRPLTKRIPHSVLYRFCEKWVSLWWDITGVAVRLTGRRFLSWFLLIADYRGIYPLSDEMLKEWSILDSFDMLSPAYDFPQTIKSVNAWFEKAGLAGIEVSYGFNGIEGRGTKSH